VFCLEAAIFKPKDGDLESDDFDEHAHHVLLIHRESGQAIGTTRVIPPSINIGLDRFPMTRAFAPGILNSLPPESTGEISRFAISKQRRLSCGASVMVRLGLMQGIVRLSGELGLTHWCAIMEPRLVRLFRMSGIDFQDLGPPVDYFGWRMPVCADIKLLSVLLKASNRDVWNYVSLGGTLWGADAKLQVREPEFV
jgi:N-acyl-L-homoserine lactone synthetase